MTEQATLDTFDTTESDETDDRDALRQDVERNAESIERLTSLVEQTTESMGTLLDQIEADHPPSSGRNDHDRMFR